MGALGVPYSLGSLNLASSDGFCSNPSEVTWSVGGEVVKDYYSPQPVGGENGRLFIRVRVYDSSFGVVSYLDWWYNSRDEGPEINDDQVVVVPEGGGGDSLLSFIRPCGVPVDGRLKSGSRVNVPTGISYRLGTVNFSLFFLSAIFPDCKRY